MSASTRTSTRRWTARRGYALLLVMLLSVSAGMILAVMMDDAARVRRQGQAEVRAYLLHHAQAGLRDLIELAVRLRGINLAEVRGEKAGTLALRTQPGEEAAFDLRDGQGEILWDNTQTGGPVMTRAAALLFQELGPGAERYLRTRGPARISINAAERPVLRAVLLALDPECKADVFADRVIEARQTRPLVEGQIPSLVAVAAMQREVTDYAVKLFTTDVIVYRVDVKVRSAGGGLVRYRGLIQADQKTSAPTAFLSFDPVAEDEPAAGVPRRGRSG